MPMCLIPMDGTRPVAIDKAVVLFGRQPDCDVVLKTSRKVSRRHCCVAQINGEVVIRDLGSMNGVRINGELIRKEGRLRVGDELHIGDVGYRMAVLDSVPKKNAAAAVPARKPMVTPDPRFLSQDVPVIMPDEGQNFAVEETSPKMKAVPQQPQSPQRKKKVIELSEDDILDE
jgi:predicted component of type VI protein secretion system